MPVPRSCLLAAWSNAFFAGQASLDQVVDAVTRADGPHVVTGLPDIPAAAHLRELLVAWRRAGERVRAVLPVPGDVRGVPGPRPFPTVALDAGEAAFAGGIGVAPAVVDHAPSSAPASVIWQAYAVGLVAADHLSLEDTGYELAVAIRECASTLTAAQVSGSTGAVGPALSDARRAGEALELPPGHPPRAVGLLAQAERLQAVVDLALADPLGGAVDRAGVSLRVDALRPLATAVRRARLAGYNAGG
ncbi:hypothetical protein [uncultured Jatrophihabitans sp.]|uniref:hypothetical protein n=1 Tax=uncultured Jatrophihabitans sp. TaxID=1610747 RepID=UPI0035CAA8E9